MAAKIELYKKRIETIFQLGVDDVDIDDEYIVKRIERDDGKIEWKVVSITYGVELVSSKISKKLINFCKKIC
jgi:hypothetical protein